MLRFDFLLPILFVLQAPSPQRSDSQWALQLGNISHQRLDVSDDLYARPWRRRDPLWPSKPQKIFPGVISSSFLVRRLFAALAVSIFRHAMKPFVLIACRLLIVQLLVEVPVFVLQGIDQIPLLFGQALQLSVPFPERLDLLFQLRRFLSEALGVLPLTQPSSLACAHSSRCAGHSWNVQHLSVRSRAPRATRRWFSCVWKVLQPSTFRRPSQN